MEIFKRALHRGDGIKPFMVAGVLEKKYEGERSWKAYRESTEALLSSAAEYFKSRTFLEYDEITFNGTTSAFKAFASDSPVYAAGSYSVYEKYALMPIHIVLESDRAQKAKLGLVIDRCTVIHNGVTVFENPDIYTRPKDRVYVFEHQTRTNEEEVLLDLTEGENRITVLTARINRSSGFSFMAYIKEIEAPVYAKIPLSHSEKLRESVHESFSGTHMEDDSYIQGDVPKLIIGDYDSETVEVTVTVDGKAEALPIENGAVYLKDANKVGNHKVEVVWKTISGETLAESFYTYGVANTIDPLPGFDNFKERRNIALEILARKGNALALYRLGREAEISEESIKDITGKIIRREDCADFHLLPLLWLAWEDRSQKRLSESIHKMIREAALSFRYWVDEGGTSSMFYCSENHRIGFHVCEYLAGLIYPIDVFTNSNQNGLFHSMKGRMHLMEWLTQRSKMGFDEPHSDNYFPVTLSALLVLREVLPLEEYPLRNMVNILLDFMTYIAATSMIDGAMGTPRARSYYKQLRSKYHSPMTPVAWALFGNCRANTAGLLQELAFSYYVPPKALAELADDYTPANIFFKQGLMHFDKYNADFTIRRTPDYIMGGVRDHNVGACDMHFTPMMAALKGDITVFISAPQNIAEGAGLRPDYWAGEAHLPRVLNHGRVMATIFHDVKNPRIWMTHCHFPTRRFDEVRVCDGWTFGRSKNGYIAIWSSTPHYLQKSGTYAERELIADGKECVWLTVCGSLSEDGGFESFIEKITSGKISDDGYRTVFTSPDGDTVEFVRDEDFKVNGKDVEIPEYLALSPWLKSKYGSGKFEYSYKDYTITAWTYAACE